mmetsp:Transcript_144112/g.447555  ORF Transcript_144112/g.447555 Transcript_144112/m.447555 type:complete len:111 (-) Transcript_144112:3-335(-)
MVSLEEDGSIRNDLEPGAWETAWSGDGPAAALLVLRWDRWPADVLETEDGGQTWQGDVLPQHPGEAAGFVVLRRGAPPGAEAPPAAGVGGLAPEGGQPPLSERAAWEPAD